MAINFSNLNVNGIVWVVVVVIAVIVAFVVIRFFWQHILRYLLRGCLVILAILAVLAVIHYYFKLF
jgi:hypothetical protein